MVSVQRAVSDGRKEVTMAPQPFIYFLKWVSHYHKALQAHYARASHQPHNPDVNALLAFLAHNEGALARVIEAYEHDAPDTLLNAWFKISPSLVHVVRPDTLRFDPDAGLAEVVEQVLKVDEGLIEVYEMLLRQANSEDLCLALEDLISEEHREAIRLMACELV